MSSMNWRYLAGNTASFAIELTLIDSDADDWMVDSDERATWGAIALWVNGINLCEHAVQGETLRAAHWYLLPIVEWLVDQWDPLLHEERLPIPNAGTTAARGAQRAALLAELEPHSANVADAAAEAQRWEQRHSLRFASPGALMPDLYIRRYGDQIEFSTGNEPIAGADWGIAFTSSGQVGRIAVARVASALYDALNMLAVQLRDQQPDNSRYRALGESVQNLSLASREAGRVAWLSGAGDRIEDFKALWQAVDDAIPPELRGEIAAMTTAPPADRRGTVMLAPPAALLFGSLAPDVSADDMVSLYRSLLGTSASAKVAAVLAERGAVLRGSWPASGLTAGEQGSVYGEEAWRMFVGSESDRVDISAVLRNIGIAVDYVTLRDVNVRAVSMISPDGAARIAVNRSFRLGISEPVERFTLAHELGHLLLDQDRASNMVVASGPWAPQEIEQRANAFAAAFLIPVPLLDARLTLVSDLAATSDYIRETARVLGVSFTALVSRLQNLGRLAYEEADALREVY
jgi:Zn-dependent peptidase ImmA (M78 family)